MALIHSPRIATDGLVLCLDAGNSRSTYLPGSYSNFFDGDGDFITFPANAAFNFGTGSFTIEAWVYLSGNSLLSPAGNRDAQIFDVSTTNTDSLFFLILGNSTTTGTGLILYNGSVSVTVTTTIPQNQWNHIAAVKSGTSVYFFVNGTQVGTTQTTSGNWGSSTFVPKVGGRGPATSTYNFYLNGHISNLRVLKGTALYTSNFTVPTSPLTNIINTSLLTCQSSTFIDNSTNNFAATVNGNTSIQSANPFLGFGDLSGNGRDATLVGSPTLINNSFDFTSDSTYVSIPSAGLSPGTSNFSYSMWVKFDSIDTYDTLFELGSWVDSLLLRGESALLNVFAESAFIGSFAWTRSTGIWYNVVFVRSSSVAYLYVNGAQMGSTFSMTTDVNIANPNLFLMRSQHTTGQFTDGQLAIFNIYNRALSAAEIQQNFNALRGRFGL